MENIKSYQVYFGLAFIMLCFVLAQILCNLEKQVSPKDMRVNERKPVQVEYFKNGQILFPDYACPDTLIVTNAEQLNEAMAYVAQNIGWGTDADCDSLIHLYAVPYTKNSGLQPENFQSK